MKMHILSYLSKRTKRQEFRDFRKVRASKRTERGVKIYFANNQTIAKIVLENGFS